MSLAIHWFRHDLRIKDNPALRAAAQAGAVLPVYVLDDTQAGDHALGAAGRVWLHRSLAALNQSLGGTLSLCCGNAEEIIPQLARASNATAVYWNRCYEPWRAAGDARVEQALQRHGIAAHIRNGSLLWEPWEAAKKDGEPYKVFTPFYRNAAAHLLPHLRPLLPAPRARYVSHGESRIESLALLSSLPWEEDVMQHWQPGEAGAQARLQAFLRRGLLSYAHGRDVPSADAVSRLSPHLRFGEISPHQIYHAVARTHNTGANADHFVRELAWREFSYHLLHYFPELPRKNFQPQFNRFPWRKSRKDLASWQKGQTGIPMVDAGMRELWQTGYMHNRVRMIVASFLVKNLRLHWREGARWFWDCLLDADAANNAASWQWVAGCGADAAPYFRIFNPVLQSRKFDPDGIYLKRFVPELATLPTKYIHAPWEAPDAALRAAGIVLGDTYPHPMVDLSASRDLALQAYRSIKR